MSAPPNPQSYNLNLRLRIIAAYFADNYYNDIYLSAKRRVEEGKYDSLTDSYTTLIGCYMRGIADIKNYNSIAKNFLSFYHEKLRFESVSLSDVIHSTIVYFVPAEYHESLTTAHKDKLFCSMFTSTALFLGKLIIDTKSILESIIDDHKNAANIDFLTQKGVEHLQIYRSKVYSDFVKQNLPPKLQENRVIPVEMFEKLRSELVAVLKSKTATEVKYETLLRQFDAVRPLIRTQQDLDDSMRRTEKIEQENKALKRAIEDNRREIEALRGERDALQLKIATAEEKIQSAEKSANRHDSETKSRQKRTNAAAPPENVNPPQKEDSAQIEESHSPLEPEIPRGSVSKEEISETPKDISISDIPPTLDDAIPQSKTPQRRRRGRAAKSQPEIKQKEEDSADSSIIAAEEENPPPSSPQQISDKNARDDESSSSSDGSDTEE
ncbi:MAG: hypothetical protein M0R33_15575 [Methylomonas sp.]|jgi:predicted  nucleic acid-binding Zn-ribbon protein|uniref:hypothetical protein n=1 Tax=Methylomonas sp. TaxID=418 RepID=UPI0025EB31B3|nr:hypothetical protein [Methylomonas sp.]MCK9607863.1 hypothetical protein [Methylomonas sp.]